VTLFTRIGDSEPIALDRLADLDCAKSSVATSPEGRFLSVGDAIERDVRIRDELLALSPDESVARFARLRFVALGAPIAWTLLVLSEVDFRSSLVRDARRVLHSAEFRAEERDPRTAIEATARRERIERWMRMQEIRLFAEGALGIVAAIVVVAGLRRWRALPIAVGLAAGFWWLFHAAERGRCFGASGVRELLVGILGLGGAAFALFIAPSESTIVRRLRERLGLPATDTDRRDTRATVMAVALGLLLPSLLVFLQKIGVRDSIRLAALILITLGAFALAIRVRPDAGTIPTKARVLVACALLGFGLATAADLGGRAAPATVLEIGLCARGRSAAPTTLSASSRETLAARRQTQSSPFVFWSVALVAPIAEEILYRGVLQRLARRSLGPRRGMLLSTLVFGLAHLATFRAAVYQHFALGLAFSATFELAGGSTAAVAASAVAHVLWNLWLATSPVF